MAGFVMGWQFSFGAAIQEDHELVTSGPYRLVRHPGYAGILGFQAGYALVFRSKLCLAAVAPLAAFVLWRIRDEEGLRPEFGERYEEYCERTARLIPHVH
jgi:protein-S-isoprenylcysteine O-methyltransferase Ste14